MATGTVFTTNRTQAVRLPAEMRLPDGVKRVTVRARGAERVISPEHSSWDSFFVGGPLATEDFLAERADQFQSPRSSL